jgi:predicted nucleic acid-binding protein
VIVVADTSPLVYLILIGHEQVLPALYGRVIAPRAVILELSHTGTPKAVRDWVAESPSWLHVASPRQPIMPSGSLGRGELEAIALAQEVKANVLLLDDQRGRKEAMRRHLHVVGTLRVLADAADAHLIDLPDTVARLRQTSFRASEELFEWLLRNRQ